MCRVLGVSRSAYYEWLTETPSLRSEERKKLREAVLAVHMSSRGTYGRRRIRAHLAKAGQAKSIGNVEKRMQELQIRGISPRAFVVTTKGAPKLKNSPNLIKDEAVKVSRPNQAWVSDLTFIRTDEGWLYLCIILDLHSRKIVGWSMRSDMKAEILMEAAKMSFKSRQPNAGLIFHSDCGGQYKAQKFRALLCRHKVRQSMTFAGNCYDNATAESFFGTLKSELVYRNKFATREQAKAAVFEYIEVFYNRFRLHSAIGNQSPVDFEKNVA
jgi:putative transposase